MLANATVISYMEVLLAKIVQWFAGEHAPLQLFLLVFDDDKVDGLEDCDFNVQPLYSSQMQYICDGLLRRNMCTR